MENINLKTGQPLTDEELAIRNSIIDNKPIEKHIDEKTGLVLTEEEFKNKMKEKMDLSLNKEE